MVFKDADSIIKDIKSGKVSPVYLLHGEESYFIDKVTNYIEHNLLPEGERSFNQEVFYGKSLDIESLLDYARQFPMMSQYRVLIVREAQGLSFKNEKGDFTPQLEAYMHNPSPTTVLILAHKNKKVDGRSKWAKIVKDKHTILESNVIREYQVKPWIANYLKNKGHQIDSNALELVTEYLGTTLSKVVNELDKLIVNLEDGIQIGLKEVESNIGISKDYNIFELQDALIDKNYPKTFRIVNNFQGNLKRNPMELTLGSLFSFYQRLFVVNQNIKKGDGFLTKAAGVNPYFLKKTKEQASRISQRGYFNVFKILSDYDGRIKGVNNRATTREELLKEMIGKLLLVR